MFRHIPAACAMVLLTASATTAFAADTKNDAMTAPKARISLNAAVVAAEQHVQGKAMRAEYELQKGGSWVYDVEVAAGEKVFDVKVDPDKGSVIASTEDRKDNDDLDDKID